MKKLGLAVLAGLMLAIGTGIASAQNDGDVLRQMKDRLEIEDLMWRYTRALDTTDAEAYASVYTPDGQFQAGATATKGHEALKKMVAGLRQRDTEAQAKGAPKPPAMYHMTANHRIVFTGKDNARVEAYYITAFAPGADKTPLRVAAVGRSVDELVRVNGKWLIKTRNVAPQD
jgi:uncharacterized protein (TIGR02246 family)